jgi:hypothetical protein
MVCSPLFRRSKSPDIRWFVFTAPNEERLWETDLSTAAPYTKAVLTIWASS